MIIWGVPPGLLLSGACDSLDMHAIESVSFASSDFKLRMCAYELSTTGGNFLPERIRLIFK
jgi:hypothetical protein